MDQRFTLQRLIAELGTTQIQAMLWRLDHMKSSQTTVDQEFDFLTGHLLTETSPADKRAFLKQLQTEYIEHLAMSPPKPRRRHPIHNQPEEQSSPST